MITKKVTTTTKRTITRVTVTPGWVAALIIRELALPADKTRVEFKTTGYDCEGLDEVNVIHEEFEETQE